MEDFCFFLQNFFIDSFRNFSSNIFKNSSRGLFLRFFLRIQGTPPDIFSEITRGNVSKNSWNKLIVQALFQRFLQGFFWIVPLKVSSVSLRRSFQTFVFLYALFQVFLHKFLLRNHWKIIQSLFWNSSMNSSREFFPDSLRNLFRHFPENLLRNINF